MNVATAIETERERAVVRDHQDIEEAPDENATTK